MNRYMDHDIHYVSLRTLSVSVLRYENVLVLFYCSGYASKVLLITDTENFCELI